MKNRILWFILSALWFVGCSDSQPLQWSFKEQIQLNSISPVGIAYDGKNLWLSDPDNNRVVKTDLQGNIVEEITNLQRPMHIVFSEGKLFVPEYLTDTLRIIENGKHSFLSLTSKLNAPAGIAVDGNTIAIADFYNHRVLLKEGDKEISVGREGQDAGELYYPTDVSIHEDLIYVADAYNNRIQVYDPKGYHVKIIGWNDGMNVTTGLAMSEEQIAVTDFYGNRVLLYNLEGNLEQVLNQDLNKPTDIYIKNSNMFVTNYGDKRIIVFETL